MRVAEADADRLRGDALRRARVWRAPAVPIASADLAANPSGVNAFAPTDEITCKFLLKDSGGVTPKFQCVLEGGEVVKVKYGRRNSEVFSEVAATRLLRALGFGADLVSVVKVVRCQGCPAFPYPRFEVLDAIQMDDARVTTFQTAAIERELPGLEIEGRTTEGWNFDELVQVSHRDGGASPAEVDALRLLAVFLAHWDSKAPNQRLLCPEGQDTVDPMGCRAPLAMIQDLGKVFGPRGVDLAAWRDRPVWADPGRCRVSMKEMPYEGAGFADVEISEGGRALLASLLGQLRPEQIHALFLGARFPEFTDQDDAGREVGAWVAAFQKRAAQIASRTCPGTKAPAR